MKKNSGKSTVDLEKGKIENPPDIEAQYKSQYAGKTRIKKEDGRRNVPIIEDKIVDPYKGISKKSKVEGDVDNTVTFDKEAYRKMEE